MISLILAVLLFIGWGGWLIPGPEPTCIEWLAGFIFLVSFELNIVYTDLKKRLDD